MNRWIEKGEPNSRRFMAVIVVVLAVLTFSGTAAYELVWDDLHLMEQVETALLEGKPTSLFTSSFHVKVKQSAFYYRPVMMASLLLDRVISGGAPWFSHLVNIFLHALNALLVLLFFRKVLGNETGAITGAVLFAVYPVHAEAVAVVSSRMDLLVVALLLPPALHYAVRRQNRGPAGLPFHILMLFSFFLACLTKETAFMFPFLLLAMAVLLDKKSWKEELLKLVPVFITAGTAFLVRSAIFAAESAGGAFQGFRAGDLVTNISFGKILKILVINMSMAINPLPQRFHWFSGDVNLQWPTIIAAGLFPVFFVWVYRRNRDAAIRGIVWWSFFTIPVLGLFNLGHSLAAERYAYIPSVGICLMAGGLMASFPKGLSERWSFRSLTGVAIILLMVSASVHARNWRNEISLFANIVETNPSFADGYINLGAALAREGNSEEALLAYAKADSLAPGQTDAAFNRGNLFYSLGKYEEALDNFRDVLDREPDDWEAALNMGNVLASMDRTEEAARSYQRALKNTEKSGKPLVGLAMLAGREGRYEDAVLLLEEAISREPTLSQAFQGMGEVYAAMGKPKLAEKALLRALELSPASARAAVMLGEILMSSGNPEKAIHAFRTALASNPAFVRAWVGFYRASEAAGMSQEAERAMHELARRDPALARDIRKALSGDAN